MQRFAVISLALVAVGASACSVERTSDVVEAREPSPTGTTPPTTATSTMPPAGSAPAALPSAAAPGSRPGSVDPVSPAMPADPTTSTAPPAPRRISMAFTGDILPHSPLWRQAGRNAEALDVDGFDFRPMLSGLAPVLESVDLAVCHLETPIAPEGEEYTTAPFYGVPAEVVDAIAVAGYERCSTASNHVADRGTAGVDRTVDLLTEAGIGQSGLARVPAEIEPDVFTVEGVRVTHLSYTFSYNGLQFPEGQEWRSAMIDPERIASDVETARALGAEVVVVSLHWGEEKVAAPSPYQLTIAEALTSLGTIDLIVGHHAHVLQPIEQVNGTWVVYGLGNVLSNMPTSFRWPDASQDAAVVTVEFVVDPAGGVTVERPVVHPTWVDKDAGWTALLVLEELARDDITAGQRGRLERSLDRTVGVVGDHVVGS